MDLKPVRFESAYRKMFSGVDLHLQPYWQGRKSFGEHSVGQGDPPFAKASLGRSQPGVEDFAECGKDRTDRLGADLDEVDVFGISMSWPEMQLVDRGSSAEDQSLGDLGPPKHFDESSADDQVLLDLSI